MLKSWQLADAISLRDQFDNLHRFLESMSTSGRIGIYETGVAFRVFSPSGIALVVHKDDHPDAVELVIAIARQQMSDIADRLRSMGVMAEPDPGHKEP